MEYGILGPLEVVRDGTPVHVGPLKQRALLILLLVHANRVMPIDRLINELWAGRPPAQATITLQSYISSLRRTLEPGRQAGAASTLLVWRSPGYLLRVEPDELDTHPIRAPGAGGSRCPGERSRPSGGAADPGA